MPRARYSACSAEACQTAEVAEHTCAQAQRGSVRHQAAFSDGLDSCHRNHLGSGVHVGWQGVDGTQRGGVEASFHRNVEQRGIKSLRVPRLGGRRSHAQDSGTADWRTKACLCLDPVVARSTVCSNDNSNSLPYIDVKVWDLQAERARSFNIRVCAL